MIDVMTCVIYDVPFGTESGHEVALFEQEYGAQEIKENLEKDGFQATVRLGNEGPRRFCYLKTNADFGSLWCILGCYFDAYLRFQVMPDGLLQLTESCGCEGCRPPIEPDDIELVDSLGSDPEAAGDGHGLDFGLSDPRWN